jgi:DNA-directed RNA polymerase I, II, and III subunit RPABC2
MGDYEDPDAGGDMGADDDDQLHEQIEMDEVNNTLAGPRPELMKIYAQHPELNVDYMDKVYPKLQATVLPPGGDMTDPNHKTYPYITRYEMTKIIGVRANQLSQGAKPYIDVPKYVTNVCDIARLEYEQKRLPFIIKRPLPDGRFEYWRITDLINNMMPG